MRSPRADPIIARLATELREHTGTRLVDWVDHLALCDTDSLGLIGELADVGYHAEQQDDHTVWRHTLGMFPPIIVNCGRTGIAIRCECAEACLTALPATLGIKPIDHEQIIGVRGGTYRHALIDGHADAALWIVERHGYDRFGSPQCSPQQITAARSYLQTFRNRQRNFEQSEDGFAEHNRCSMRRPKILAPIGRATCSSPPNASIGKIAIMPAPCNMNGKTDSGSVGRITTTTRIAQAALHSLI